jgi:membrane protease YdiL (CAAX protease family)
VLSAWLIDKVPRDHWETDAAFRRRRRVVGAVSVAGAGLLGLSLSTRPDSPEFYGLTLGVAGTWLGGSVASGPLHLGWMPAGMTYRRPVVVPVMVGAGAFAAFYAAALAARRVPRLRRAVASVLQYAEHGNGPLVLLTTLANGAAEELFFRGAVYDAAGRRAVPVSTAAYVLATSATRNPALVLASVVMGALFAAQRRSTGGIQAPLLTHLTWSALMLRFLPPLFKKRRTR